MNIAIVGATGLVGREMLKILNERGILKNSNVFLYASKNSAGQQIVVGNFKYVVEELNIKNMQQKYHYALFSAGKSISEAWANEFVRRGATVIDNSSAFRRKRGVPLVVPEINFDTIKKKKLIANPNCSTIGASLPICALARIYEIKRIVISTYQAVSGAGQKGIFDLQNATQYKFSYCISNNLIPQIDKPLKNGYTFEEDKMEYELKKILQNKKLKISTTCVRVPIENCHSESINIEFNERPNLKLIKQMLNQVAGVMVVDDLKNNRYPMPINANGQNDVLVGRVREDTSNPSAINFFICFDNIRKGAALNAVQILERLENCKSK